MGLPGKRLPWGVWFGLVGTAIFGIAGTGGVVGLAADAAPAKDYDKDRGSSAVDMNNAHFAATSGKRKTGWLITPVFTLRQGNYTPDSLTPLVGIKLNFR